MSLLLGDTGKSQMGSLKTYTITPGTTRETLLTGGSILTMPTTEPVTSQVIYTVQASDLPTITGNVPVKYNACLYVSGKVGATASVINYRVLKNGTSIVQSSGASATSTQYWAHSHWRTFDITVGDVLEVRYWAVQVDVTLDWYGLAVFLSQPDPTKRGAILKDLTFPVPNVGPTFTVSNISYATPGGFFICPTTATNVSIGHTTASYTYPTITPNAQLGLFRTNNADNQNARTNQVVSATTRTVDRQYFPDNFSFREVLR